jgi:excisionase family DNA binding protein
VECLAGKTRKLPETAYANRATSGENRLTLYGYECHNALHGKHSEESAAQVGVRSGRKSFWRSSGARVTFLVSESREVMNVRQASQYLGISPDTLYRYITEGEIPAFKLGNRWKLRKTILDRWMERKMSQSHSRRR